MNESRRMTETSKFPEKTGVWGVDKSKSVDVELSVVIAIQDPGRTDSMQKLYRDYKAQIERIGLRYEFIMAIEGKHSAVVEDLRRLKESGESIRILVFARWHGGATALSACFEHARGNILLMLPAYHQIKPQAIPSFFSALGDNDMIVARRWPREDGYITRIQIWGFHAILHGLLGVEFSDLGCSVIAFKKKILESVDMYGDRHRFFSVLTSYHGFKVKEVNAPQTRDDTFQSHLSVKKHVNRLLDLLSIIFLTKFTKKPLRFFGFIGTFSVMGGGIITLYLSIQRLFMGVPLANKPVLLLGVMLIVLGVLLIGIGLVGEMIIFTNSDRLKSYVVEEVV